MVRQHESGIIVVIPTTATSENREERVESKMEQITNQSNTIQYKAFRQIQPFESLLKSKRE